MEAYERQPVRKDGESLSFCAGFFDGKEECMEIRTDGERGKLLFKWEPRENTVYIVNRDLLYEVRLIREGECGSYRIVRCEKKKKTE